MVNVRLIEHVDELRRQPGTRREVHRVMEAGGLAVSGSRVPEGAEVAIDGVVESIADGMVMTATVAAPWSGECRRCLTDIQGTLSSEVREVFEPNPTEGETWPLHGDGIDLAPVLRETVLLSLPLAPLCSEACPGPAPEAFPTVVSSDAGDDREDEPPRDPRWAALDQLRGD